MDRLSDPKLVAEQYQDASNLKARLQLHDRFSTNKRGWHKWSFDQFLIPESGKILELGCGSGVLWKENKERIPPNWYLTLSDLSPGMLEEARKNVSDAPCRPHFQVMDAQSIPIGDDTFDVVIANQMLYHVPDISTALSEIHRVLKPRGTLYAATGGKPNGPTIKDWVRKALPKPSNSVSAVEEEQSFTLENGATRLAAWFTSITLNRYVDSLEVTEAQPLVDYVRSMISIQPDDEEIERFEQMVQEEIQQHGVIHLAKSAGMFVAEKAN